MSGKSKKYHFIYKTTNNITQQYYVGRHSTDNLEDGYLGSGKKFKDSLLKYGKENFTIQRLDFFKTKEELINREEEMVNESLIKDKKSLNIKKGGNGGGFVNDEHKKKFILRAIITKKFKLPKKKKIIKTRIIKIK